MENENKGLDFRSQQFYVGLDVHKTSWQVTIRSCGMVLKTFKMEPSAEKLLNHLQRNYPGGVYHSVYEAGFSGFWTHRALEAGGVKSIIVSPHMVPTSGKEKVNKNDDNDSRKLARELENNTIRSIYIPTELQQEFRSLVRLRHQLMKTQTRLKNQIKSYLNFYGQTIPENTTSKHWSRKFIEDLEKLSFRYDMGKEQLSIYLEALKESRGRIVLVLKKIRAYIQKYEWTEKVHLLMSVPGIGFITAITMYAEIMDIKRFQRLDELASYVGLAPSIMASGENERALGLNVQYNRFLRNLLIEAAWVAVRIDPAITSCYNDYLKRMNKKKAIVKIAKKLLNRIRAIWNNKIEYGIGVIK